MNTEALRLLDEIEDEVHGWDQWPKAKGDKLRALLSARGDVQVVLPERRTIPDRDDLRHTEFAHGFTAGWNACLDAIHGDAPPPATEAK